MKLSIITVCLNSRRFIAETIESVLSQDYHDVEHVIVDGGSTDGTVELIRSYAANDARIVWTSESDRGISDAMNKGVLMASGDVIVHLNSDDYFADANVLARVASRFNAEKKSNWLTAGLTFVNANRSLLKNVRVRRYSFRRLLRGNIVLHPATFIRRSVFLDAGGFDVSLHFCMDYDLFLRLGSKSQPCLLDQQLTCFRVHPESRSVVRSAQAHAEEFQVRMNFLAEMNRPTWFYRWDYQFKKRLNRLFYYRLMAASDKQG